MSDVKCSLLKLSFMDCVEVLINYRGEEVTGRQNLCLAWVLRA